MFNIPVILLKNLVILPNQEIKLELNNVISGKAINEAEYNFKGEILVIAPIDALEEDLQVKPQLILLSKRLDLDFQPFLKLEIINSKM